MEILRCCAVHGRRFEAPRVTKGVNYSALHILEKEIDYEKESVQYYFDGYDVGFYALVL